jgi:hypothetical protein
MSAFLRIAWIVLRKDLTVEIRIYNKRGTAEQWIKEGKQAAHWTRLSCHRFRRERSPLAAGACPRTTWQSLVAARATTVDRQLIADQPPAPPRPDARGLVKHARYYWGKPQRGGQRQLAAGRANSGDHRSRANPKSPFDYSVFTAAFAALTLATHPAHD